MMKMVGLIKKNIFLIMCVFIITACSDNPSKIPESLSDADLYTKGQQALQKRNYMAAIEHLQALESRYPFGPFSIQGQLDLAYAYLKNDDFQEAHAAASRFIRLHADHPNADYAHYLQGLSSYLGNQGFIEKYFPVNSSERDPGQALKSFQEFSELISRYPDSTYVADARKRMIAMRNRMAENILIIAGYYLKRHAYVAAINRSNEVINHYQQSPSVESALGIVIESYRHLGLMASSDEALAVLKTNFPQSKLLNAGGEFIGYQVFSDVNPSFWHMVTFGLISDSSQAPAEKVHVPQPPEKTGAISS